MCDKTETALAVLKEKMPEEIGIVFEQVVADNKKQGERMTRLEKGFTELNGRVASVEGKLDKVIQYIERGTWLQRFWEKYGDKLTLVGLFVLACSILGLSLSEVIQLWKGI